MNEKIVSNCTYIIIGVQIKLLSTQLQFNIPSKSQSTHKFTFKDLLIQISSSHKIIMH